MLATSTINLPEVECVRLVRAATPRDFPPPFHTARCTRPGGRAAPLEMCTHVSPCSAIVPTSASCATSRFCCRHKVCCPPLEYIYIYNILDIAELLLKKIFRRFYSNNNKNTNKNARRGSLMQPPSLLCLTSRSITTRQPTDLFSMQRARCPRSHPSDPSRLQPIP